MCILWERRRGLKSRKMDGRAVKKLPEGKKRGLEPEGWVGTPKHHLHKGDEEVGVWGKKS